MSCYYVISFFIIGIYLGSLYNIIGFRLPKNEKIVYPSLNIKDHNKIDKRGLIPVINYFMLKKQGINISVVHPIIELCSGILFSTVYLKFGFTIQCLLILTFISMLLIIIVSDYCYMIICDQVLIIFGIILLIELYFIGSLSDLIFSILSAIVSFTVMFIIKKIGDAIFKKDSMGGGDIKLLGIIGLVLGIPMSFLAILLASILALPLSLIMINRKLGHEIPFGPFLSIAAIILLVFNNIFTDLLISLLF